MRSFVHVGPKPLGHLGCRAEEAQLKKEQWEKYIARIVTLTIEKKPYSTVINGLPKQQQ